MHDDAECLRRYSETGDQQAFEAFVRANVDLVYAAAFRQCRGDRSLAQDVTQIVFAAAARKARLLSTHPVVQGWLYQTARYAALDTVRSHHRRQAREQEAVRMNQALDNEAPAEEWEKISPQLDELIQQLSKADRHAVVLRYFGGQTFAEIGAKLGLSEGGARMRVDRALDKLRVALSRRGVASTSMALGALLAQQGVMAAPPAVISVAAAAGFALPAAGALTATATLFQFMTTAKTIATAATAIAVLGAATAIHQTRAVQTAEKALAETRLELDAIRLEREKERAALARPAPAPASAAQTAAASPAAAGPGSSPATSPGAKAPGTGAAARGDSVWGAALELLGNRSMQQQTSIQTKFRLDGQYAAFFKWQQLSPAQIDQLKGLLVEKQMVGFDSMAAARDQGIDHRTNPQGFFQAMAASAKMVDDQVAALLGTDGYSHFQQYEKTIPARNTAALLQQALSYTPTPLTDAQTESVITALAQHGKPFMRSDNPFAVLNGDLGVVKISEQGEKQLQTVLTPPQLAALKYAVEQQQQLGNARQNMGR